MRNGGEAERKSQHRSRWWQRKSPICAVASVCRSQVVSHLYLSKVLSIKQSRLKFLQVGPELHVLFLVVFLVVEYFKYFISLASETYFETHVGFAGGTPVFRAFRFRGCRGLWWASHSFCPMFAHKFCLFFTFQNVPQTTCHASFHGNTSRLSSCIKHKVELSQWVLPEDLPCSRKAEQGGSMAHSYMRQWKAAFGNCVAVSLPFLCVFYIPKMIIVSVGSFECVFIFSHLAGWPTFRHLMIKYFCYNGKDNNIMDCPSCPTANFPPSFFNFLRFPPPAMVISFFRTEACDGFPNKICLSWRVWVSFSLSSFLSLKWKLCCAELGCRLWRRPLKKKKHDDSSVHTFCFVVIVAITSVEVWKHQNAYC